MRDAPLDEAKAIIADAQSMSTQCPVVRGFFDDPTNTVSYVIHDPETREAAVLDSVLDYDPASGRTSCASADAIISYIKDADLKVTWQLETHVHADHLSAAPYLKHHVGGDLAIGCEIAGVQRVFAKIFNEGASFACDGSQFDRLFCDGETFNIGHLRAIALHVPGHTPADLAYVVGDAVFTGDTLFMPDYGTARADFPGGDARQLFRSIRRLMKLPEATRMFHCHDYKAAGRNAYMWETTVGAQRNGNVHVHEGVSENDFVTMREARDADLAMPRLLLPSIQVNMRGGQLPEPEPNGVRYLKIPLDTL